MIDLIERDIYTLICGSDGIKARDIAKKLNKERSVINHYLYSSPYMHDLCYQDRDFQWHGLIQQGIPHVGLGDFSGFYGTVGEFLALDEQEWFDRLMAGCKNIGRNLNDTRGLFHSFRDTAETMRMLFEDLNGVDYEGWEIVFELRIKRSKMIRIYADVLVITEKYVFSMEFKMNDKIEEEEVAQAAKYCEYLEVLFGSEYDVIPVLVLTRATDLYCYSQLKRSTAEIPVCSGDMLFNVFDEYMGFLQA